MPKPRHRAILDGTLLAILFIFLLGGMAALGLIELHRVHSFQLEMKRTKAVRFLLAPAGFTSEALQWVEQQHIHLADQSEI